MKETQVAALPAAAVYGLPLLLPLAAAAGEYLKKQTENLQRKNKGTVPPFMSAKPEAPLPPSEPLNIPESEIKNQGRPATPPRMPGKLVNIPVQAESSIEIYPELDDKLKNLGLIVESKGNPITKAELDRIRDYYIDLGGEHIAGGRDKETGKEKKEYWIGGSGQAFPTRNRRPGEGDGRKGGKRTDLTFRMPDGKIVHVQSVDVDKNGNPTQREQDNAYRVWLRTDGHDVILHPKGSQMEQLKK